MHTIRSLLWIGTGRGLAQSGLTEAPQLDVTWTPDFDAAEALPPVRFDGLLVEMVGTISTNELDARLTRLERLVARDLAVISLSEEREADCDALISLGVGAVFVTHSSQVGPGFMSELDATLEELWNRRKSIDRAPRPEKADSGAILQEGARVERRDRKSRSRNAPTTVSITAPIVRSEVMQRVFELVDLAAASPSTVLITGETGVGKEVIARALHARSERADAAFLGINCAAFPEQLLESELFGHRRGAFTGADRSKTGLFEAAGNGTLFLDEIAETSLGLQARLLRVLQEREIRAVGDTATRPIHCRIIAATNRVLAEEVRAGHFREDLFYRLNVFPIAVPPLRDRRADILPMARAFLQKHGPREHKSDCHLSLAAGHLLEAYRWPGNVRELENEILRALMIVSEGGLITPRQLSPKLTEILEPIAEGARTDETLREALDRVEGWLLRRALANQGGRKARTARRLGLTREGLYKKLKRLGIE
jgi:transcriptional regulator with PAS, ATPase and Fis domain